MTVQPVVEGASGDSCAGADLADSRPLPASSYAPASQLHNVSGLLHAGTLYSLSTHKCARDHRIAEVSCATGKRFKQRSGRNISKHLDS